MAPRRVGLVGVARVQVAAKVVEDPVLRVGEYTLPTFDACPGATWVLLLIVGLPVIKTPPRRSKPQRSGRGRAEAPQWRPPRSGSGRRPCCRLLLSTSAPRLLSTEMAPVGVGLVGVARVQVAAKVVEDPVLRVVEHAAPLTTLFRCDPFWLLIVEPRASNSRPVVKTLSDPGEVGLKAPMATAPFRIRPPPVLSPLLSTSRPQVL